MVIHPYRVRVRVMVMSEFFTSFIMPVVFVLFQPVLIPLCPPGPASCLNTECAHGFPSSDTVNMYGPTSRSDELNSTSASTLYIFPSMNFSCNGTITDIRMRMDFIEGLQSGQAQIVWVYFLLFRDELTTPNRSITQILLNRDNTEQYFDGSTEQFTEIWQTVNLSLLVTEGDFIGFAVPANNSKLFNKNINLSPTSERVEAYIHQLSETFSEFVAQLPDVASAADSSQFTTQMIGPPLIDVTFSK